MRINRQAAWENLLYVLEHNLPLSIWVSTLPEKDKPAMIEAGKNYLKTKTLEAQGSFNFNNK